MHKQFDLRGIAGWLPWVLLALFVSIRADAQSHDSAAEDAAKVDFRLGVRIPLRDGVHLNAIAYFPKDPPAASACILRLTPYGADYSHEFAVYFAAHGLSFFAVDSRGRGDSEGEFHPFIQEARDGYDIVEWLAQQPYCHGKVGMWGGSYEGYDQWATAKEFPPHLLTIVPVAAPAAGVDFPWGNPIIETTVGIHWQTLVAGHGMQIQIYGDSGLWNEKLREWLRAGTPFKDIDSTLGNPSPTFQEWVSHPHPDSEWDRYNPTPAQYARISLPILTITGSYDGDQAGALAHYKSHMRLASPEARVRHYLVIGPWDHGGTRRPRPNVGGVDVGSASLVDLKKLHLDWYRWTLLNGPKPEFLRQGVACYVMGSNEWRYADTLAAVTTQSRAYALDSAINTTDVLGSGSLALKAGRGQPDHYLYDPRDLSNLQIEPALYEEDDFLDQRLVLARHGRQLVYHTAPFEADTVVSGFFKLTAWIAIDQPDTDFLATVYEITPNGGSIQLSMQMLRARYRESQREPTLVQTRAPLRYDFDGFTFVARTIQRGSRLRLVISPPDYIDVEKNYNSGGEVAAESVKDARPVTVTLYHDSAHQSVLYVPLGMQQEATRSLLN